MQKSKRCLRNQGLYEIEKQQHVYLWNRGAFTSCITLHSPNFNSSVAFSLSIYHLLLRQELKSEVQVSDKLDFSPHDSNRSSSTHLLRHRLRATCRWVDVPVVICRELLHLKQWEVSISQIPFHKACTIHVIFRFVHWNWIDKLHA